MSFWQAPAVKSQEWSLMRLKWGRSGHKIYSKQKSRHCWQWCVLVACTGCRLELSVSSSLVCSASLCKYWNDGSGFSVGGVIPQSSETWCRAVKSSYFLEDHWNNTVWAAGFELKAFGSFSTSGAITTKSL